MEKTLLQKAIVFAAKRHGGDVRKGTDIPYIVHPIEVMKIAAGITDDEKVRAAAVLHDTLEDTGTRRKAIERRFGSDVCNLVLAESENKRKGIPPEESWKIRKRETIEHIADADRGAKIICLADKLANMRDMSRDYAREGEDFWNNFNAPDDGKGTSGKKANIGWYYRKIADALKDELGDEPAWKELDMLVEKVFQNSN